MQLSCHGGKCCGIKVIHGFYTYRPSDILESYEVKNTASAYNVPLQCTPGMSFWHGKAPQESMLQRLDRFLEFCRINQSESLIEAVLADYQKKFWEAILIEKGFKPVTSFKNSNSHRMVTVYHLINKPEPKPKKQKTETAMHERWPWRSRRRSHQPWALYEALERAADTLEKEADELAAALNLAKGSE